MQILPNVYEIKSTFGNRYIQQYLFVGDLKILLDAGVAETPDSAIFPYLQRIGLSPEQISLVIAMHPDADHHGGLPAIKDVSRSTLLACHIKDLDLIENPENLYQRRYNHLAYEHLLGFGREGMKYCDRPCKIDLTFSAGDIIQVSNDWRLQIWHVPGHSDGHLALFDEKHHTAFTSDAVQGLGNPAVDGTLAFGPTYYVVDAYLATIGFLEKQPIEHMFSGHWPHLSGSEIKDFLKQSRDFVERADELIGDYMCKHARGITLKDLVCNLSASLGTWPSTTSEFLQFALYGHLERLEQLKIIRKSRGIPATYTLC